jgi:phosphocarrier protein
MQEVLVKIKNEEGMHARPAGVFVKVAGQFQSKIEIDKNGICKNGKSIMNIMSLGLQFQDDLLIRAIGEDAEAALNALKKLVENKFILEGQL